MKSHFLFTNQQRNGIFFLLAIIFSLQILYWFVESPKTQTPVNTNEVETFRAELDSLRLVEIENDKPKIYPFNPNFITDYKGYTLGMSNQEIDRLLQFRSKNQWVNSAKQFQHVTKVSDSLLATLSPFFKFPEWVTNPKPKSQNFKTSYYNNQPKTYNQKQDLNTATAAQLQKVYGIGEKLSQRIIQFKIKQNGFASTQELNDVYGLMPETILEVEKHFVVKTPRKISKYNLNQATREELVTIPHIDYEIAHNIIEERTLRNGFKTLDDLLKVDDFPTQKIGIIKLYLFL